MIKRIIIVMRLKRKGFSLVEVAFAVGIASFCLITLLALLPLGVRYYRDASAQSTMINLATMVVCDLQATRNTGTSPRFRFTIPPAGGASSGSTPQTVYVKASGVPTGDVGVSATSDSIYRISVYFAPPNTGLQAATSARILITFPAQADPTPASNPTLYADLCQTVVALNRN